MARLHLINTDPPRKCLKCGCILLSKFSITTKDAKDWAESPDNCARVKSPEKPSQPIDYKDWK